MKICLSIIMSFLWALPLLASPCFISGEKDLREALQESRDCRTRDRERLDIYKDYLGGWAEADVLIFDKSGEILLSKPLLIEGENSVPLLIIAGENILAEINGENLSGPSAGVILGRGRVLLDRLVWKNFPGPALEILSDDVTLLRQKLTGNGTAGTSALHIFGSKVKLVQSEILRSGLSGVVVSDQAWKSGCSGKPSSARKVTLVDNLIYENGKSSAAASPCGDSPSRFPDGAMCAAFTKMKGEGPSPSIGGYGIVVDSEGVVVRGSSSGKSRIFKNTSAGIFVNAHTPESLCNPESLNPRLHSLFLSQVEFFGNGTAGESQGIVVQGPALPAPEEVIVLRGKGPWIVSGRLPVEKMEESLLMGFRPENILVEVYASDPARPSQGSQFLGSGEGVETDGKFSVEISLSNTEKIEAIVVLAADAVQKQSSPFSQSFFTEGFAGDGNAQSSDWDGDGLRNEEEDQNRNGALDWTLGETDPRRADTDGDGLTDGEERLHTGRVAEVLSNPDFHFSNISSLDPVRADSDGDCLPDGLELGAGEADISIPLEGVGGLESDCLRRGKTAGGGTARPENGLWQEGLEEEQKVWETVQMFFDLDPASLSDPTSADTDGDGLSDGMEDENLNGRQDQQEEGAGSRILLLESSPSSKDSDGDGLSDGEEKICSDPTPCDPEDSNRLWADTDNDGLLDGEELHLQTLPNDCDTDQDRLGDGLEAGVKHPEAQNPLCTGLQSSGSNFHSLPLLNPTRKDSDGDGLEDGTEDANHNGWLEENESDPTLADTDGDGLSDGLEMTGDSDGDGFPNFDYKRLENGKNCSPPAQAADLDCDGFVNAQDTDSDEDGCGDAEEGPLSDQNGDGILDVWQQNVSVCSSKAPSSPRNGTPASGGPSSPSSKEESKVSFPITGGGACSLISSGGGDTLTSFCGFLGLVTWLGLSRFLVKRKANSNS